MRKIVRNKKGAEMTIGTLVIIVLALVVLVVLIIGFTSGWGSLWEWLSNIFGGNGPNLDAVISGCDTACTNELRSAYCDQVRDVRFPEQYSQYEDGEYNCKALESMGVGFNCAKSFGECDAIEPSCKVKIDCASKVGETACKNAGCRYTPETTTESEKCEVQENWISGCAEFQVEDACNNAPIGDVKPCEWR